jgi:2-methylisocitrate lyase-like PEP mutase family enzyme
VTAGAGTSGAGVLRGLHVPGRPLLLPNVWDPAGAVAVQEAGFPVVATSSYAVAESLGHRDGAAPGAEMLAAAARVVRAVDVPVTVDAEAGYGLSPAALVNALREVGAVGCNLEDSVHRELRPTAEQAGFLRAVREADPDLVLNARIDVFLGAPDPAALVDDAVARARAYLDAGADCVYPILVGDRDVLARIVDAVAPAPVNTSLLPGGPSVAELAGLGVARISLGAGLWLGQQAALRARLGDLAEFAGA